MTSALFGQWPSEKNKWSMDMWKHFLGLSERLKTKKQTNKSQTKQKVIGKIVDIKKLKFDIFQSPTNLLKTNYEQLYIIFVVLIHLEHMLFSVGYKDKFS